MTTHNPSNNKPKPINITSYIIGIRGKRKNKVKEFKWKDLVFGREDIYTEDWKQIVSPTRAGILFQPTLPKYFTKPESQPHAARHSCISMQDYALSERPQLTKAKVKVGRISPPHSK